MPRRGRIKVIDIAKQGTRFPAIREHLQKNVSAVYNGLDVSFASFPPDTTERDSDAYKEAIDAMDPGDAVSIFTPAATHYPIAMYAIERGIHVLITKPAVKLVGQHQQLLIEARKRGIFVFGNVSFLLFGSCDILIDYSGAS